MTTKRALLIAAATVGVLNSISITRACELPPVSGLSLNNTGAKGNSANATINTAVSGISADVTQVRFDANNAYINATGIPSHSIGPWPTNPNMASQQNLLYRLPLSPQVQSGTKTSARILAPIGFMVNGVPFFDATDGRSYNNQNIWHQNANVVEAPSFDAGKGYPQQSGMYHYHQQPALLRAQLGDDGTHHSPLLGFAYDGFPVYGPYGYAGTNGTGAIERMDSSYRLKNMTTRTNGPSVSSTYPLGYYIEDYEYAGGLGDLDIYNGRFAVTPEYP